MCTWHLLFPAFFVVKDWLQWNISLKSHGNFRVFLGILLSEPPESLQIKISIPDISLTFANQPLSNLFVCLFVGIFLAKDKMICGWFYAIGLYQKFLTKNPRWLGAQAPTGCSVARRLVGNAYGLLMDCSWGSAQQRAQVKSHLT